MNVEFKQVGEVFYKCNTCGVLEKREIGLYQKRHKNCSGHKIITLPIGTRKKTEAIE